MTATKDLSSIWGTRRLRGSYRCTGLETARLRHDRSRDYNDLVINLQARVVIPHDAGAGDAKSLRDEFREKLDELLDAE